MASITLSTNTLIDVQGTAPIRGIAGEIMSIGKLVYIDPTTNKFFMARSDAAGTKVLVGITRSGATANGPVEVAQYGLISNIGTVLTAGVTYVLSAATYGAIAPIADLVSTNHNVLFGLALTTSTLLINIKDWGYQLP